MGLERHALDAVLIDKRRPTEIAKSIMSGDRRPGCLETGQWLGQLVRFGNSPRRGRGVGQESFERARQPL